MILGVDPSSSFIGLAWVDPQTPDPLLVDVQVVRCFGLQAGGMARTVRERLLPQLQHFRHKVRHVYVEDPPATFKSKHGRSGSQAVVGKGIGRAMGAIECAVASWDVPVVEIPVGEWHGVVDALHGPPGPPPAPPRPKTRIDRLVRRGTLTSARYAPCGHVGPGHKPVDIQSIPTSCPTCSAPAAPTDELNPRKVWSVDLVRRLFPGCLDALIQDAESRAEAPKLHPSQLAGVADAADAVCVALAATYAVSGAGVNR